MGVKNVQIVTCDATECGEYRFPDGEIPSVVIQVVGPWDDGPEDTREQPRTYFFCNTHSYKFMLPINKLIANDDASPSK